jgi:hypothetical protein
MKKFELYQYTSTINFIFQDDTCFKKGDYFMFLEQDPSFYFHKLLLKDGIKILYGIKKLKDYCKEIT